MVTSKEHGIGQSSTLWNCKDKQPWFFDRSFRNSGFDISYFTYFIYFLSINDFLFQVRKSEREYPTLLHVAAKLGLKHLFNALKTYPGYQVAICMKNKDDRTASQLALREGHIEIAATIMPDNISAIQSEDLAPESNFHWNVS